MSLEWFQWDSTKYEKHREAVFEMNDLVEDYQVANESLKVDLINGMDDVSCNNLMQHHVISFFLSEEVINEIKIDLKELIKEGIIQPSKRENKTLHLNASFICTYLSVLVCGYYICSTPGQRSYYIAPRLSLQSAVFVFY